MQKVLESRDVVALCCDALELHDILHVARTCRLLREMADGPQMWRSTCTSIEKYRKAYEGAAFWQVCAAFRWVPSWHFHFAVYDQYRRHDAMNTCLGNMAQRLRNLRALTTHCMLTEYTDLLYGQLHEFPSLTYWSGLRLDYLSDSVARGRNRVTRLDVYLNPIFTNDRADVARLPALFPHLTGIEALSLPHSAPDAPPLMVRNGLCVLIKALPQLTYLSLRGTDVSAENLAFMSQYALQLKVLDVRHCLALHAIGSIQSLRDFPTLQTVIFGYNHRCSDRLSNQLLDDIGALPTHLWLCMLELPKITLSIVPKVNAMRLERLRLEYVHFADCNRDDFPALFALNNVQFVEIDHMSMTNDVLVKTMRLLNATFRPQQLLIREVSFSVPSAMFLCSRDCQQFLMRFCNKLKSS